MFRIEVNHVKSGFFCTSKRNEIFASNLNFASEAKVRAHPNIDRRKPKSERVYIVAILTTSKESGLLYYSYFRNWMAPDSKYSAVLPYFVYKAFSTTG